MANLSNINGKFVVDTAGNIGVGTLVPRSDANTTNISIQSSGTARLFVNNTGASGKEYAIYSSANGDFGIFDYGAVSARLIINSSGNATFAGNVGIGTDSADGKLNVVDTSNPAATSGSVIIEGRRDGGANVLTLRAKDASAPTSALPNAQGAVLRWQGFDGTDFENMGYIYVAADGQAVGDGDAPSFMAFGTSADGSSSPTERMRIDSSGNTTFTGSSGAISGTGNVYINNADDAFALVINNNGTSSQNDRGVFDARVGGSSVLRINNSGNVGIGTTNLTGANTILDLKKTGTNQGTNIRFKNDYNENFYIGIAGGDTTGNGIIYNANDSDIVIYTGTGGPERMRITSGGNVFIGNTSFASSSRVKMFEINPNCIATKSGTSDSTLQYHNEFHNPNGFVGSISTNGSATAFTTSSDYRLKENVVEMTGALDRVSQLKPSRFNFIADADKTVDGFLAHEVQEIVPEAITGEKDAMRTEEYEVSPAVYEDVVHPAEEAVYETVEHPAVEEELDDEGNIIVEAVEAYTEEVLVTEAKEEWTEKVLVSEKVMGTREVPDYQGIDQSKLVPLLVGAIQELKAEIESLKQQINN